MTQPTYSLEECERRARDWQAAAEMESTAAGMSSALSLDGNMSYDEYREQKRAEKAKRKAEYWQRRAAALRAKGQT